VIRRNKRTTRGSKIRQLQVEHLENRHLLATLTVNSPLDNITPGDGLVTLREAVQAANDDATTDLGESGIGADRIRFDTAAFVGAQPTLLALGEIEITQAVSIDATQLVRNVTIDANRQSRIFNITASSGDFTLAGLTLTGGRTTGENGGAVKSVTSGTLTIDRSAVSGNHVRFGNGSGGGVFADGDVRVFSSTDSNNIARGSGGGILSGGDLRVISSTISGNRADGAHADAGGIFALGNIRIYQSTITNNKAEDGGGIGSFGAISISGSIVAGNSVNAFGTTGLHPDIFPGLDELTVNYSLVGTDVDPDAGGNNLRTDQPQIAEGGQRWTHSNSCAARQQPGDRSRRSDDCV
jgi:hypothetical protein